MTWQPPHSSKSTSLAGPAVLPFDMTAPSLLQIYCLVLGSEFQISRSEPQIRSPASLFPCPALRSGQPCRLTWQPPHSSNGPVRPGLPFDMAAPLLLQICFLGRPCGLVRPGLPFDMAAPSRLQIYSLGRPCGLVKPGLPFDMAAPSLLQIYSTAPSDEPLHMALAQSLRSGARSESQIRSPAKLLPWPALRSSQARPAV